MNAGAGRTAWPRTAGAPRDGARPAASAAPAAAETGGRRLRRLAERVRPRHVLVLLAALAYPLVATPFFTFQVGAQALALGLIALSLTFLAGYGGMVSLAQMTVAGIAGYMYAIFATSGTDISLGWPWWLAVLLALAIATVCGTLIGWFSVRTEGIYTIMITLAIGVAFFYLVQQNYSLFNGFQGFQSVKSPRVLGVEVRDPVPFYYLALFWALTGYFGVQYLLRAPFGVALQGIRDNPRRMAALGFHVTAHRVAAYAVAGLIAAVGDPAGLVQRPGLPGLGGHQLADQHPRHRRARRDASSHRAVHRRRHLCAAAELRRRSRGPRAVQPAHRRSVPGHRAVLAGRRARLVGSRDCPPARAVGAGAAGTSGRGMRGQLHSRGRGAALTTKEEMMRSLLRQCMRGLAVAAMVVAVAGTVNAQQVVKIGLSPPWKGPSRRAARTACGAPTSP